jgi:predicted transcriptional regulator
MTRDDEHELEPASASPPELAALLRYLKALADESRLRMVGILATSERSVEELAAILKLRAPTVSHHLALLREAGLVTMRPEGNTHIYRLNAAGLGRMNKLLSTPEHVATLAHDEHADAWGRKVLRDFLEDGRLKQIPARLQKRRIILRWLCDQFEYGRTYTEKEVNALLKRYHPDTAYLRRELIDERFMAREAGNYWRREQAPTVEAQQDTTS